MKKISKVNLERLKESEIVNNPSDNGEFTTVGIILNIGNENNGIKIECNGF